MDKELTPLAALEDVILYLNAHETKGLYCKNIEIIKDALKRLEKIDNQVVLRVDRDSGRSQQVIDELSKRKYVNFTNLVDCKRIKAFNVIKKKDVDVGWLKTTKDLERYNDGMGKGSHSALTKKEFDLLKEVLL